jgi:hypothetical protein
MAGNALNNTSIPVVKKPAARSKPGPLASAREQQESSSIRGRGSHFPTGRYVESKKNSDSSPSFISRMLRTATSVGQSVVKTSVDTLYYHASPVVKASAPAKTTPQNEDLVDLCDDDSGDDHTASESQEGLKPMRAKLRHKHKDNKDKADGSSRSPAQSVDTDPEVLLETGFRAKFRNESASSSQPTDDHTARNLFASQQALDNDSSDDEKVLVATKPTAYKKRLLENMYQQKKDSPPPDPTPQQDFIEWTRVAKNYKPYGNVDMEDKKSKNCRSVQKRKKEAMLMEKQHKAKRRQEDLAANPICLDDDDDDEVKEVPKNMDAVRVPRKRPDDTSLEEGKMADLGGLHTVLDSDKSQVGKRQSFSQSPPDTNSVHTQPDSPEEKAKWLHIEDDDADDQWYSQQRSSQASEHSQSSALCHPGQHVGHVETPVFGNLGVSDLVPKTCYSPSFDTDKLNTALTSIEQGEPGSWNVRDKLERSETQTPCLNFQKVNGVENKKGIENKKGKCVAEQKEMEVIMLFAYSIVSCSPAL